MGFPIAHQRPIKVLKDLHFSFVQRAIDMQVLKDLKRGILQTSGVFSRGQN